MAASRHRWVGGLAAMLTIAATAFAGCGGSGSDKAGGADKEKPRVVTLANPNHGAPPAQLLSWASEVKRLSAGRLAIRFENGWRIGQARYEAGTLDDVRAGKVDMAWVGARVFDTVGVESFRALVAPLLVDSYELEARVFDEGIPARMLDGVDQLRLVGVGVLPGPLRKLLGVSKPFVRPADFAGQVVGIQASSVAERTLRALGATPRAVPSSANLHGLDAYEQQLSAIEANGYDRRARFVTANVNLWPRPLVLVMGKRAHESLTDEQQSVLREAAAGAVGPSLAASRAEDDEAAPVLCRRGLRFAVASPSDVAELRAAVAPIYAELAADPATRAHLDDIRRLKAEVAAAAEAPRCARGSATGAPSSAASIPDGTYETRVTRGDWLAKGIDDEAFISSGVGVFTLVLESGQLTLIGPDGQIGFDATYTVYRDRLEATGPEDTVIARWSFRGKRLALTQIDAPTPYVVVWGSHPWVKVR